VTRARGLEAIERPEDFAKRRMFGSLGCCQAKPGSDDAHVFHYIQG
jgi:hypothetical protein